MRHLLAQVDPGLPIEELEAAELITPNIDWYAVSVHLILMVGGVLVLTVASLWRKHPDWFAPMATVAIAVAGFLDVRDFAVGGGGPVTLAAVVVEVSEVVVDGRSQEGCQHRTPARYQPCLVDVLVASRAVAGAD